MTGLSKLLEDYTAKAGEVTFAISSNMKKKIFVEDKLKGACRNVIMYPTNYAELP